MKKIKSILVIIVWLLLISNISNAQWKLTGNAGTTPGTNFIGTTDAQSLVFKINSQKAGSLEYSPLFANTTFGYLSLSNNVSGKYNCSFGYQSLVSNSKGSSNTAIGYNSLNKTIGSNNTGIGYSALYLNTNGVGNTAFGYSSLYNNTIGYSNVAIGRNALYKNTEGHNLVALGDSALFNQVIGTVFTDIDTGDTLGYGYENTAVGSKSLFSNTKGYYNTALGFQSLYSNKTGTDNTAAGYHALYLNTANGNTAFGSSSLSKNTTGAYNVAVGTGSLGYGSPTSCTAVGVNSAAESNGTDNSAFGNDALGQLANGSYITAIGANALSINSFRFGATLTKTTAVGWSAGNGFATTACTYLGHKAQPTADALDNSMALGFLSTVSASNQVRVGNSTVTSIGGQVGWTTLSDGRFKKDLKQNVPGLEFINKLQPVTYHINVPAISKYLKEDRGNVDEIKTGNDAVSKATEEKAKVTYTGFVAQEVEKAAKEINYDFSGVDAPKNKDDYYGLRYSDFVVPLVKAVQELSKMNDSKDSLISDLQKQINDLKSLVLTGAQTNVTANKNIVTLTNASIEQNSPNPFSSSTVIRYQLPSSAIHCQIIVTSVAGNIVKTFSLAGKGLGSVTIPANELAAGSYYYSLLIDGKKVDTKQMILAK